MNRDRIAVLGAGRMGHAIASALLARRIFPASRVFMADPSAAARRRAARLGCRVTAGAFDAASWADTILLAVKPQKVDEVANVVRGAARGKRLISILAGTTRLRLCRLFPGARVIRVMPNTALLAGKGAIVIAKDGVLAADLKFVRQLFSSMGKVWLVPEKLMNAVTAVSGSGPALFCAFLEACVAGGSAAGLPRPICEELAVATMAGTHTLLENIDGLTPAALREMVTSPGGTTEAALRVFARRRLNGIVREAIRDAVRRGKYLSR